MKGVCCVAASLAFAFVVTACGEAAQDAASKKTNLAITVENTQGRQSYRLACEPPSGNVPQPVDLCRVLSRNGDVMLFPPDRGLVCSAGALTVFIKITGRYRGEMVDRVISACNGRGKGEALWLTQLPPPPGWDTSS